VEFYQSADAIMQDQSLSPKQKAEAMNKEYDRILEKWNVEAADALKQGTPQAVKEREPPV